MRTDRTKPLSYTQTYLYVCMYEYGTHVRVSDFFVAYLWILVLRVLQLHS